MFLVKLNLLIPSFVLMSLGGFFLAALLALGLSAIGLKDELTTGIAFALSFVTILVVFIRFWTRKGFVPIAPRPGRELRYRFGHGVFATSNVLLATSVAIPVILAMAYSNPEMANLLWLAIGPFVLALVAWPFGLYMIWTSRP